MIAICDCLRPHFSGCCFSSEKSQSGHLDRYHNPISFSRRVRLSLAPRKFDGVESKDEDWKLACRPLSSLVSHFSQTKLMQYYHRPPSSSSGKSFGSHLTALCPSKRRPRGRPWSRSASAWRPPARAGCSPGCGRPRRGGGRHTCSGRKGVFNSGHIDVYKEY